MNEAITVTVQITYSAPADWILIDQAHMITRDIINRMQGEGVPYIEPGVIEVLSVRSEADVYSASERPAEAAPENNHVLDSAPYTQGGVQIVMMKPQQMGKTSEMIRDMTPVFRWATYKSVLGDDLEWMPDMPRKKKALRAELHETRNRLADAHDVITQHENEAAQIQAGADEMLSEVQRLTAELEASKAHAEKIDDIAGGYYTGVRRCGAEVRRLKRLVEVAYNEGAINCAQAVVSSGKAVSFKESDAHAWLSNAEAFNREMADADRAAEARQRGKPDERG